MHFSDGQFGRPDRERFAAVLVLASLLEGGRREALTVEAQLRARGVSERTYRRARVTLNVRAVRSGSHWWLELPGTPLRSAALETWPVPWESTEQHAARHRRRVREAA